MFVLVVGSVFFVLLIPLAAWALVALSRWTGLVLGTGLLACAAGWLWLMAGWVPPGLVSDSVLALVIVTPALIMTGRLADRVAVVRRAPPAAPPADVQLRLVTAHSLPAVCVCLNVGVLVVLVVTALYLDLDYTPPSADVLPLPAAVTVVSDRDLGCPGGPPDRCEREIDVTGAAGVSLDQAVQAVTAGLTGVHGWRLGPGSGPGQGPGGCRYEGWFLGREDVCVQVQYDRHTVQVILESGL